MNEALERLSLLAFIKIWNSFSGMFMASNLRVWYISASVRLSPGLEFETHGNDLESIIQEAVEIVVQFYRENKYERYLND